MKTYRIVKDKSKKWKDYWLLLRNDYTIMSRFATLRDATNVIESLSKHNDSELFSVTIKVKEQKWRK